MSSVDSLLHQYVTGKEPLSLTSYLSSFLPFLKTGTTFLLFSYPVYQRFSTINFLGLFKIHIYIVLNGFSLIIPCHF